jgi:Tetratricopeptide repeat
VRKAGNRVRITGQLIDTASGAHIWADRFDGALDDIFELQDQVASSVAGAIEPKLRQSEIERARRKPTESLDAYDLYLRALAQFDKYTEEGMREAIVLLQRALAIDPSYAPAAAMIGWCRSFQRIQGCGLVSDAEVGEGVRLARRAIEAGKDDPDSLWMAGGTLWVMAGELSVSSNVIDRALALNPNSAHAWMARGMVSCFQNQSSRAIESLQRAMRLSPLDPLGWIFAGGIAFAHLYARRFEDAIEWVDRALLEQPRWTPGIRSRAVACALLGRTEEARDWLNRMLELQPGLTIATWKASFAAAAFSPDLLAFYVEGLRKAGLPEA